MGKIRIKAFDESSAEDEAKLKAKREAKKAQKEADKARVSGMGGGQRVKTVGPSEEELMASPTETPEVVEEKEDKAKKTKKAKFATSKDTSKRHKENQSVVSKTQSYNLDQALEALKKFKMSKFDETVELHINVKEKGVNGQLTLPHGTGKKRVIKIADEKIIDEVSKGKITFDVLVATPQMMPSLAKVARVLGPRGLMPNPKNGTISDNPEKAVKDLEGGQVNYKTESDHPIIHVAVGKVSFEDKKLKENIDAFLSSVGSSNIRSVILKSTMSPAIRLTV